MVRGKLPAMSRITLGALIVIDVHARDVVEGFHKNKISDVTDFNWISQLRYYLEVCARYWIGCPAIGGGTKWGWYKQKYIF